MRLRAHHLLCLLGFRGLGYSREYVENMTLIADQLRSSLQTSIEVVSKPDDICSPCPFLGEKGCQQRGVESEERARGRDQDVMKRLNVVAGDKITWSDVEKRIRSSISPEDLGVICQNCQWLPQGYCVEGLERLKRRRRDKGHLA
ncbi:MAG: DUF1284 domain-containing protein [Dehalococcoidia bacterium]